MKELDSRVFKILEFLSKAEYGIKSDILPIMVEMFPIINVNDEQERNIKCHNVKLFYEKLISDKLIDARPDGLSSLGIGNFGNYNWLNHLQPINAYITEKGSKVLEKEHQRLRNLSITNQQSKNNERPIKKFLLKWRATYSARRLLFDAIEIAIMIFGVIIAYLTFTR